MSRSDRRGATPSAAPPPPPSLLSQHTPKPPQRHTPPPPGTPTADTTGATGCSPASAPSPQRGEDVAKRQERGYTKRSASPTSKPHLPTHAQTTPTPHPTTPRYPNRRHHGCHWLLASQCSLSPKGRGCREATGEGLHQAQRLPHLQASSPNTRPNHPNATPHHPPVPRTAAKRRFGPSHPISNPKERAAPPRGGLPHPQCPLPDP
jgi:hypothetical protein